MSTRKNVPHIETKQHELLGSSDHHIYSKTQNNLVIVLIKIIISFK